MSKFDSLGSFAHFIMQFNIDILELNLSSCLLNMQIVSITKWYNLNLNLNLNFYFKILQFTVTQQNYYI